MIQGARQYTWKESYDRSRQLASALKNRGIGKGDTVAVMLPNTASMFECHFGVPMIGAVLNTLNTRLDAEAIAFMLAHGEARVLITDREFSRVVKAALALLEGPKPLVIDSLDPDYTEGEVLGLCIHGMCPGIHRMGPGIHGMGLGIHGIGPGIHRIGPGIHGMGPGIHGMGPGIHRIGLGIHGMGPGIHGMGPGIHGMCPGIHGIVPWHPSDGPGHPSNVPGHPSDGAG